MPVTAKLSRQFYERFGDELTNELVNWMNMVDAAYRSDFRELFEVHFGRFDAKLEQRVAQLDAKLEQRVAQLDARLERMKVEILRWNIVMWLTTLGTVVALLKL